MNFHGVVLGFVFLINSLAASAITNRLDKLNLLLYQNPSLAMTKINDLKNLYREYSYANPYKLRLELLECETLLQLGDNYHAIELANLGEKLAEQYHPEAKPYFIGCKADAYASMGNLKVALPLLDFAIDLANYYQQSQGLSNLLRLRGQLDTENENYLSAIEDLRLALDIYEEIKAKPNIWFMPPLAYLYAAMGNLLYASGDVEQGIQYAYKGLNQPESIKKIRHILLLNAARMTLDNNQKVVSNRLLDEAKSLLSSLSSPLSKAYSSGVIASIEIENGHYDNAEHLLATAHDTFKKQNKHVALMQVNRLRAKLMFSKGYDEEALIIIKDAINMGKAMEQYGLLELFYQMISHYYLKKLDHNTAYYYLSLSLDASRKANKHINNIRFVQFKARLSQHLTKKAAIAEVPQNNSFSTLAFNSFSLLIGLLFCIISSIIFIFFKSKKVNKKVWLICPQKQFNQSKCQQLDLLMKSAKNGGHPFNLLIIDTQQIADEEQAIIEDLIRLELREQDIIFHYTKNNILILLPFTSASGAKNVIKQLENKLQIWQHRFKIGSANMQYFDTPKSLIKRAIANQVCYYKELEFKVNNSQVT